MSNQPLRDLIHRGESQSRGYNDYNGGTYTGSDGRQHIRESSQSIDFSSMTLGEVQARQHRGELFAVGLYQVIPHTMDNAVASLNLDPKQRFTPELQDRIFSEYLVTDKRPEVRDYVMGKAGASLHAAEVAMSLEWASFGDPNKGGASHYGGANAASISVRECGEALQQMRADYQTDLAKGLSPAAAFKDVTIGDAPLRTQSQGRGGVESGVLMAGDRSSQVAALQTDLHRLGYTDAAGRPLGIDGDFGRNTQHAVEAFQSDHRLTVDGRVGPQTQGALDQAVKARGGGERAQGMLPISDPKSPDYALYQQALTGVQKIDADMGRASDQLSRNLAASLAADAKAQGLTRIDAVAISEDGARTFAVQNDNGVRRYAHVTTAQAVQTPIGQSSARAANVQADMPTMQRAASMQQIGGPTMPSPELKAPRMA